MQEEKGCVCLKLGGKMVPNGEFGDGAQLLL